MTQTEFFMECREVFYSPLKKYMPEKFPAPVGIMAEPIADKMAELAMMMSQTLQLAGVEFEAEAKEGKG